MILWERKSFEEKSYFQAILWRSNWVWCRSGEIFPFLHLHRVLKNIPRFVQEWTICKTNLTLLFSCWFNLTWHWTGQCWDWTRCPGLVLLDVFNMECTKVIAHSSSHHNVDIINDYCQSWYGSFCRKMTICNIYESVLIRQQKVKCAHKGPSWNT